MNQLKKTIIVPVLLLLAGCAAVSYYNAKVEVEKDENRYRLTVSESKLAMTIPAEALTPSPIRTGGSTDNPRYFHLKNEKTKFNISGWFEPDYMFSGAKKNFDAFHQNLIKANLPQPQNISFSKQGNWKAVSYDMSCGETSTPNLKAHWVQDGTWIDLHLSYDCSASGTLEDLLAFLSSVEIKKI